jgi:hypothetical protein
LSARRRSSAPRRARWRSSARVISPTVAQVEGCTLPRGEQGPARISQPVDLRANPLADAVLLDLDVMAGDNDAVPDTQEGFMRRVTLRRVSLISLLSRVGVMQDLHMGGPSTRYFPSRGRCCKVGAAG